nr:ADAM family mig-17-like; partial [Biomphalaria glabrata]
MTPTEHFSVASCEMDDGTHPYSYSSRQHQKDEPSQGTHVASTIVVTHGLMLQYEASEVTGDQMPDQVNVTFSTETKSLTKLNLRRSRHFDLDIPLYTLDTNQEGIFHRHKVKTRPKKTVASSSFIDRDASYDEMNADTAIDNLQAFNIGSGSSIVGIYDHVMLLTG